MSPTSILARAAFGAAERGWVPEPIERVGVRVLASSRLRNIASAPELDLDSLREGPIAPAPREANEQHYEVPPEFFELVLGPWRKYSCGYWPAGVDSLAASEAEMLRVTTDMAQVTDEQRILDLGCGWGAFSLYAAGRFPNARVTGVSNSRWQREFIQHAAGDRGLDNVRVLTADVNDLELPAGGFDRIVSIEMFEHMSNYEALLERVTRWLAPGGKLFIHVFCHQKHAYRFSTDGAGDWMGREFFTGGLMPSFDLLPKLVGGSVSASTRAGSTSPSGVEAGRSKGDGSDLPLRLEARRFYDGTHYQRTSEAWLRQLALHRDDIRRVFAERYGSEGADRWIERWRLFFLACAETFGYRRGEEWGVGHYRFVKPAEKA